jgi:aminopeptidase S
VPRLYYYLMVDSLESSASVFDTFEVRVTDGPTTTVVQTSDNTKWDDSYHRMQVNMKKYAGKSVTITFRATEDSSVQTGFLIDDVSLRSYAS